MTKLDDLREVALSLRKDYSGQLLDENLVSRDPLVQFSTWFSEAVKSMVNEPNAFTLGTVAADGTPSLRVVLMRDFSPEGFTFFTNYQSEKSQEISQNPVVTMNYFWPELARQVRITGTATRVSAEISDSYFASRPRLSCIGAWASPQSREVSGRKELENLFEEMEKRFEDKEVPRPPHWGGFSVRPHAFEFWQGRPSRFHDRICYERDVDQWRIFRLAP